MACRGKILLLALLLASIPGEAGADIITRLPSTDRVIALTFDACETRSPSYLDKAIVEFLVAQRIPSTIFVSGKFAERNRSDLMELSKMDFMEIENHSLSHRQHMERLSHDKVRQEVLGSERIIEEITGRKPRFFRFPAGNTNGETLRTVESLGYRVVHWTFASGDPARETSPERLCSWVLGQTRPGSILIFHINGRGYSTGDSLPRIVEELRKRGYRMVKLSEALGDELPGSTGSSMPPGLGNMGDTPQ